MKSFKALAALLVSAIAIAGVIQFDAQAQSATTASWSCDAWQQGFPSMMGNGRGGMMNSWSSSGEMWGMMGNGGMMAAYPASDVQPILLAAAQSAVAAYASTCGAGVSVAEVDSFASSYVARLVDASGANLMDVVVDRYTGVVFPEPGPTMMWNTRSGLVDSTTAATYDFAAAQTQADTFLASYAPSTQVSNGQAFPGYFTFDYGHDDVEGMLSVNAATGAIWVHTWLGPAIGSHDAEHE